MARVCFACGRSLGRSPGVLVACADEQTGDVGPDCLHRIAMAGVRGYQPPRGGPRLYLIEHKPAVAHA